MSKLYYAVPVLGLVAAFLALVLVGMVPNQLTGISAVTFRTISVLGFGTATWMIALTTFFPNRFGLYANTLLLIVLVSIMAIFGQHAVTRLGLEAFGSLIATNILLILWLHQRLPESVDEKDYH